MGELTKATYSQDDIEKGLMALLALGSSGEASKALKDAFDLDIPASTLRRWRVSQHAQLYAELQEAHGKDLEDQMVRELRDVVVSATGVMREAIEQTAVKLQTPHTIRPTEMAQIALNMAKVQQTAIDKMLALTGRPQSITENRSAADIIRALAAKGIHVEP